MCFVVLPNGHKPQNYSSNKRDKRTIERQYIRCSPYRYIALSNFIGFIDYNRNQQHNQNDSYKNTYFVFHHKFKKFIHLLHLYFSYSHSFSSCSIFSTMRFCSVRGERGIRAFFSMSWVIWLIVVVTVSPIN